MQKKIFLIFPALFYLDSLAQKTIDGLINAEKSFAAFSVTHSTKEAFLKFLDSSGIVFDQGKPVNGFEFWNKREKRPGILNWSPQYAGISASGDLGFTSGPWTFQQTSKDTVIARGQYTTVWHINKNGEWKFLVDLGVNHTQANPDTSLTIFKKNSKVKEGDLKSLLKTEEKFIASGNDPGYVYKKYLSPIAVLNRNDLPPQYAQWNPDSFPQNIQYTINGSGIALSGDLGYVYGTTIINGKTDNYLRIWRKEKEGWKTALEVLRY